MSENSFADDFKYLENTSTAILQVLRNDENKRNLESQFRSQDLNHHRYFLHPYIRPNEEWGSQFSVHDILPLPTILQDDITKKVHTASLMGVLPEINRVWISIDNKLMFWNYLSPKETDRYDGFNDIIVSVALSAPKPGIFLDNVKYLLVVATTVEVTILAITLTGKDNTLKIIPTNYTVSSDQVPMLKVVGSQSGRIFMGGQDGHLYELEYDNIDTKWANLFGFDSVYEKCQKRNHSILSLKTVLPPFISSLFLPEESIKDLIVDDIRKILYIITSLNHIRIVHIGSSNYTTINMIPDFNIYQSIRHFISLAGRSYDTIPRIDYFQDAASVNIINLSPTNITESRDVHSVIVLENGIRVYLQLLIWSTSRRCYVPYHPSHIPTGGSTSTSSSATSSSSLDCKLEVLFIRGYPSKDVLKTLQIDHTSTSSSSSSSSSSSMNIVSDGYMPDMIPSKDGTMNKITKAYYSHGVFLSLCNSKDVMPQDQLICMSEDITNRKSHMIQNVTTTSSTKSSIIYDEPVPNLMESVSSINVFKNNYSLDYKVYDIKEACPYIHMNDSTTLWNLYTLSGTPSDNIVNNVQSSLKLSSKNKSGSEIHAPSVYYNTCITPTNRQEICELTSNNTEFTTLMNEFLTQSLPLYSGRFFLCLTRFGLIILKKNRPIDYFIQLLSDTSYLSPIDNFQYKYIDEFFQLYGTKEALTMCLHIICGYTRSIFDLDTYSKKIMSYDNKMIRDRARRVLLHYGGSAGYSLIGYSQTSDRMNLDNRLSIRQMTPNYHYSILHEALILIFSRFIRPIWLKPVIENGNIATLWKQSSVLLPIHQVLESLKTLYQDIYSMATKKNMLLLAINKEKMTKKEEVNPDLLVTDDMIVNRITAQSKHLIVPSTTPSMKEYEEEAEFREFLSIHGYWRLLSRICQAITLIEVLINVESTYKIPVKWSDIGDVSFRSFVLSSQVHTKMKRLIHTIISQLTKTTIPSTNFPLPTTNTSTSTMTMVVSKPTNGSSAYNDTNNLLADDFMTKLSTDCYLYFSIGDRYANEVLKQIQIIRAEFNTNDTIRTPKTMIKTQIDGFIHLLIQASKYWNSIDDVINSPVNNNSCMLSTYCNMLNQLDLIGKIGLIQVCLSTAENFEDHAGSQSTSAVVDNSKDGSYQWEKVLYHKTSHLSDTQRKEGKQACYDCLLTYFKDNLTLPANSITTQQDIISNMIDYILTHSKDTLLREQVYNILVYENIEQLLRIQEDDVEAYLKYRDEKFNYEYLYRYYGRHGRHHEAANYMYTIAHSDRLISIKSRHTFLQQAYESTLRVIHTTNADTTATTTSTAAIAMTMSDNQFSTYAPSTTYMSSLSLPLSRIESSYQEFLHEVYDEFIVAGYQLETFQIISLLKEELSKKSSTTTGVSTSTGTTLPHELPTYIHNMTSALQELEYKLLPISELFNEMTLPYHVWDIALCLLNHSNLDAPDAIRKLWKSILFRLLPLSAETNIGKSYLRTQRSGDTLFFDPWHQKSTGLLEHSSQWIAIVEDTCITIINKLSQYNTIVPNIFIEQLIVELEEIAIQLLLAQYPVDSDWIIQLLRRCHHITYVHIVDIYTKLIQYGTGSQPEKMIQLMTSATTAVYNWLQSVQGGIRSNNDTDSMQFIQAMRSGQIQDILLKMERQLNMIRNSNYRFTALVEDRIQAVTGKIEQIKRSIQTNLIM